MSIPISSINGGGEYHVHLEKLSTISPPVVWKKPERADEPIFAGYTLASSTGDEIIYATHDLEVCSSCNF
jgi:hypothetical protein